MIKKNSYLYHLEEFRMTLIQILFFFFAAFLFSMLFIEKIIIFLQEPVKNLGINLSYFRPEEKFLTYFKAGLVSALFFSLPFAIFRLGYFIYPALKKNERKYLYVFAVLIPILFYAGVIFAYKVIFTFALMFFYNFAGKNTLTPIWGISNYFDLLIMITAGTGIVFLLPLPLIFLIKTNIISVYAVNKLRPYIIIIILILAAIFTPPDVISQLILAIPLYLLFEISVIIGKILKRD